LKRQCLPIRNAGIWLRFSSRWIVERVKRRYSAISRSVINVLDIGIGTTASAPLAIAYSRRANFLPAPNCERAERVFIASFFLSNVREVTLQCLLCILGLGFLAPRTSTRGATLKSMWAALSLLSPQPSMATPLWSGGTAHNICPSMLFPGD
jgi:hypothetical protein